MNHRKLFLKSGAAASLTVLLIFVLTATAAMANTSPAHEATQGENEVTGSGTYWTIPGDMTEAGDSFASVHLDGGAYSRYLRATHFDFDIPSGSKIDGIQVLINREASNDVDIADTKLSLIKGGAIQTNAKMVYTKWKTTLSEASYGGTTDKWSNTWTAEDINSDNFGVALTVHNYNSSLSNIRTATVDYIRVIVYYTLPASTTSVSCGSGSPASTAVGSSITCTATVTGVVGAGTPAGTVSWASSGSGAFSASPCWLSGSAATAACTVSYTPTALGAGSHQLTAAFAPADGKYTPSSASQPVAVTQGTPALAIANSPLTYNGSPQAVDLAASVPGALASIRYNGSPNLPTAAGAYRITASFTPADTTSYTSLNSVDVGDFIILKADPTLTLWLTNPTVTYTGRPIAALLEKSAQGTLDNIRYSGSPDAPTAAGAYTITADFTPLDTANYNKLTGLSAGPFTIERASPTATLALVSSTVTYTGSPQPALLISDATVPGAVDPASIRYAGSATPPVDAGAYPVTADFIPADSTNYTSLPGLPAGDYVIEPAVPTAALLLENPQLTYTGAPQAASLTVGPGSTPGAVDPASIRYNGAAAIPVDAGAYTVTADFVPTDARNYKRLPGLSAGALIIEKATPTAVLWLTGAPPTYTGLPQAATVAVKTSTPAGSVDLASIRYNGSADAPVNAGAYTVTASFVPADTRNYNSLANLPAGAFTILKANPTATLAVSGSPVTYNGQPQAASLAIPDSSVPGSVDPASIRYNGAAALPTNAGCYVITASFIPADSTNYTSLSGLPAGDFTISKATPTVALSLVQPSVTYTGAPQPAQLKIDTSSVTGSIDLNSIRYNTQAALPTNAGDYAVTAAFVPADTANYNTLTNLPAGAFTIQKATPTLSVANSPATFDGKPHAAILSSSVPGLVDLTSLRYAGSAAAPSAVGSYPVTADFTPSDTANYNSLTGASAGSFVIAPGTPALALLVAADPAAYAGVGEVISFRYTLTNTGDVPLSGPITVTDNQVTVTCPAASSLTPAAALTCTASRTVTAADLQAGSLQSTAAAQASYNGETIASSPVETTLTYHPYLMYLPALFLNVQ